MEVLHTLTHSLTRTEDRPYGRISHQNLHFPHITCQKTNSLVSGMTCQDNTHGWANQIIDGERHKQMSAASCQQGWRHSLSYGLEEWKQHDSEHCSRKTDDLLVNEENTNCTCSPWKLFQINLCVFGLNTWETEVYRGYE